MKAILSTLLFSAPLAGAVDFAHQVVPVLREHCGKCHTGVAKKGGFSMNTRESLLAGSENGAVLEPGKADDSLFLEVVLSDDKSDRMPPKGGRVPEDQIAVLREWIDAGLPWEDGFTFGKDAYEPRLKPRRPELLGKTWMRLRYFHSDARECGFQSQAGLHAHEH